MVKLISIGGERNFECRQLKDKKRQDWLSQLTRTGFIEIFGGYPAATHCR